MTTAATTRQTRTDIATIRAALDKLPAQCRYHGDQTEPHRPSYGNEACCDTGIPARRRRLALEALDRIGSDR